MEIKISGYSDDNVAVEGGPHTDEWGAYGDDPSFVVLSTGDRFSVVFGEEGIWRIEHVHDTEKLDVEIEKALADDDEGGTDVATVVGEFEWVDCWRSWPPEKDEIFDRMENQDLLRELDAEKLLGVYNVAKGR